VRTPKEFEKGMIPGAINIPLDKVRERMDKLSKDKAIDIYCQVGLRGYIGARILRQYGFDRVRNLSGGYDGYVPAVQISKKNGQGST